MASVRDIELVTSMAQTLVRMRSPREHHATMAAINMAANDVVALVPWIDDGERLQVIKELYRRYNYDFD